MSCTKSRKINSVGQPDFCGKMPPPPEFCEEKKFGRWARWKKGIRGGNRYKEVKLPIFNFLPVLHEKWKKEEKVPQT